MNNILNFKLIDDAGFLKEDFSLKDWVSKSTEAYLMECLGNNPENHKDALLFCMENFANQIEKEQDFERAHVLCNRVRSIELEVFFDSSPVKTQEHGNPPATQTEFLMSRQRVTQQPEGALLQGRVPHEGTAPGAYVCG